MPRKTYAVTGATGHVGKAAAERLKTQGHEVRLVSRSAGVSLEDVAALTRAFSGVDGVFLMIPPDFKAPDLRKRQNEFGEKLAEAARAAKVRRVVFLSSINGHLEDGTGPILGLHDMEERLNALGIIELVHLRPTFFMENHLQGAGLIAQAGIFGAAFRPDLPCPMIATADIGAKAAELLVEEPFRQPRTRELLGPRGYTMTEVAQTLGAAIGKPDLKYAQFPYEDARKAMIGNGMSASYADALIELSRNFNEGKVWGAEKRSAQNTTPTTIERFAQEVFRPAYEGMAAGVP